MITGACSGKTRDTVTAGSESEPAVEYIRLNCVYNVGAERAAEATEPARQLIAASQADEGMIDYYVYVSVTRPENFMIYETWKDKASLDAHSAAPHFTTLVPRLHELSASGNTDIFYF